ncbi:MULTISPECIES: APC family permease [Leuconostoc]|uniref:Amino acid transporter n=2 Tax=Leuconostoc kimchii TaxID=136609 RepID=D5T2J8_LEUKI|nr:MULTISPECIES: amino acid permease [Leuconostoc]ADG40497.1 amino acid transporter [Leuconostoc kimchii IMSNU 11154]AEJ31579.1 amino acid transporter [Leuconostoc sp. C2]QBR46967.1 amino acid permease [Leuconostoc kimchii]
MSIFSRAFKRESVDSYIQADSHMTRVLTTRDLIGLGVGTVIGTGIFILPGHEAAQNAGPAVSVAFLIAAIFSGLSGMAFAEFSSAMPVAGSAYSYGTVVYGEIIGWLLGWSLILEYFLAVSAIATGFSAYLNNLLITFGIHIPKSLLAGPMEGGIVNLFAVLIILLVTVILSRGLNASKKIENGAVILKVVILALFIIGGSFFIKHTNYVPFYPKEFHSGFGGLNGIWAATASIIFAFLGFDTIAAHAAEVKNPQKTMARGIIGTVIISALLYVLFSIVLTGIVNYKKLGVDDPAAFALQAIHQTQFSVVITVGALVGMFTAILALVYASSRLTYSFGRDGLLPRGLGKISGGSRLPVNALILAVIVESIFAGLIPLNTLASLINAGTLLAFMFINFGILILRRRKDLSHDGFKVPGYPLVPLVAGVISLLLITKLPVETLELFSVWLVLGIIWYFAYGIRHSKLS